MLYRAYEGDSGNLDRIEVTFNPNQKAFFDAVIGEFAKDSANTDELMTEIEARELQPGQTVTIVIDGRPSAIDSELERLKQRKDLLS